MCRPELAAQATRIAPTGAGALGFVAAAAAAGRPETTETTKRKKETTTETTADRQAAAKAKGRPRGRKRGKEGEEEGEEEEEEGALVLLSDGGRSHLVASSWQQRAPLSPAGSGGGGRAGPTRPRGRGGRESRLELAGCALCVRPASPILIGSLQSPAGRRTGVDCCRKFSATMEPRDPPALSPARHAHCGQI